MTQSGRNLLDLRFCITKTILQNLIFSGAVPNCYMLDTLSFDKSIQLSFNLLQYRYCNVMYYGGVKLWEIMSDAIKFEPYKMCPKIQFTPNNLFPLQMLYPLGFDFFRNKKNPLQKYFYLLILRILEYFVLRRKQIKVNPSNVLMLQNHSHYNIL